MKSELNILICPLEWGLGHAARMIPLANYLKGEKHKVFIGSGEKHISLFQNETEGLSYINFPGFSPGYSRFLPQYLSLLLKTPVLLYHIISEHYKLKKIIKEYQIDIVISDNRFGLWNSNVTTAYVTHMPRIPFPLAFRFLEFTGVLLHRAVMKRYDLCLIPDLPGELNLSGRLSHGIKLLPNVRYSGILSRFSKTSIKEDTIRDGGIYNTIILSGPEPQRGILKDKLEEALNSSEYKTVVLEGKPGSKIEAKTEGKFICYNHLQAIEMKRLISGSKGVIARSGYTTIMELISLKCSALLIPTPGQTEQEYLAEYLCNKGWFSTISQKRISVGLNIPPTDPKWTEEIVAESSELLEKSISELLEQHHKKY